MTNRIYYPDGSFEDVADTQEMKDQAVQGQIDYVKGLWEYIRRERTRLLAETDYLTLSDTTEMSDAWKTYRQQLRDLPANTSDPENPTWPTKPST